MLENVLKFYNDFQYLLDLMDYFIGYLDFLG